MSQEDQGSIVSVSKIHEQRLLEALAAINNLFPLDANQITNISQAQ